MERQSADLPPAPRSRRRDDPRRGAQGGRPAALGADGRGRVPDQSAHGPEGLPGSSSTKDWSKRSAAAACSSTPARAKLLLKGEREKFLATRSGRGSRRRSNGSASKLTISCERTDRQEGAMNDMACIEARGLRKTLRLDRRPGRRRPSDRRGPDPRPHRPQRRRQDDGAQRHRRTHVVRGAAAGARARTLERARRADARRLLHHRRRRAAAMDSRRAGCSTIVAGVHPRFDRAKAEAFPGARPRSAGPASVRELSKGMVTQLHLAIVMAIDARRAGARRADARPRSALSQGSSTTRCSRTISSGSRTVLVATHQVEEVQHVLTDLLFIDRGRIVFNRSMDEVEARYQEVLVHPDETRRRRGR